MVAACHSIEFFLSTEITVQKFPLHLLHERTTTVATVSTTVDPL